MKHYHIVSPVKYRKVLLDEEVMQIVRETAVGIGERHEIEIEAIGMDRVPSVVAFYSQQVYYFYMKVKKYKRYRLFLIMSFIPFLSLYFYATPLCAEEIPLPQKNIKGFFELDLSTQITTRTVVEETNPGVNFDGDAESTYNRSK